MNTAPCPSKTTDNLVSNMTLNLMNMDASHDQIQENLTANKKNLVLNNYVNFKDVLSPTQ